MFEADKCVIVDKDKSPVAEGIVRLFDEDRLEGFLDITSLQDISNWLHAEEDVSVYIYNASMGKLLYEGVVRSAVMRHVELKSMKLVSSQQQRNSTRVETNLSYVVRSGREKGYARAFAKPIPITITNVSAEGLCIVCREPFSVGFCFLFAFQETPREIPLVAEVIRREDMLRTYRYGCKISGISANNQNEIHRWVFSKQIEQRRKMRAL